MSEDKISEKENCELPKKIAKKDLLDSKFQFTDPASYPDLPLSAINGISEETSLSLEKTFGVKTIRDLATDLRILKIIYAFELGEKDVLGDAFIEKSLNEYRNAGGVFHGAEERLSGNAFYRKSETSPKAPTHQVTYTSEIEWNFFFWPARGLVYRRMWTICVNSASEFNDAHFWLTSCPRISRIRTLPPRHLISRLGQYIGWNESLKNKI